MSKKKGLSVNEKKTKMLEIFHETYDVFQFKDIERIAPKSKNITQQSVKVILQELVDDGLVETDKIGSGVYFWSFPGKAEKRLKSEITNTESDLLQANEKVENLKKELSARKSAENDLERVSEIQKQIDVLKEKNIHLEQEISTNQSLDYESAIKKSKEIKAIFDATNRWTDNIYNIKSWCKKKYAMEDSMLDKSFGIPEDFDYVPENEIN